MKQLTEKEMEYVSQESTFRTASRSGQGYSGTIACVTSFFHVVCDSRYKGSRLKEAVHTYNNTTFSRFVSRPSNGGRVGSDRPTPSPISA
jgi:hypothetical protein